MQFKNNNIFMEITKRLLTESKEELKGDWGEFKTSTGLWMLPGCKETLHNVIIPNAYGNTTEIDIILIHTTGIYVIENKNYNGWIFGNTNDKYWTQCLPNGQKNGTP